MSTINVTITLPAELVVERNGARCIIATETLPDHIIARLVEHGLSQKVGDAAAGSNGTGKKWADLTDAERAGVTDVARTAMQAVADNLAAGKWGAERSGASKVDAITAAIRTLLMPKIKAKVIATNGDDAWTSLDAAARAYLADDAWNRQDEKTKEAIRKLAEEEVARQNAAKAIEITI